MLVDVCEDVDGDGIGDDFSGSYYDNDCGTQPEEVIIDEIVDTEENEEEAIEEMINEIEAQNNATSPTRIWNT